MLNIDLYIGLSLIRRPSAAEHSQATLFVDAFKQSPVSGSRFWRGSASLDELLALLGRFLGRTRAREAMADYARQRGVKTVELLPADGATVHHAESLLTGAVGSASARVMIASVVE
ncbi:MAG: histidine kinase, partial [Betaproteobacteria bacterium]|nr:histidine kinase [Betaproteobacteria bacterium]